MSNHGLGTRFMKGQTPWNKGKFGYMGANKTSFTAEGINEKGKASIGVPHWNGKDGLICLTDERVERADPRYPHKRYLFRKRVPHARFVMEQHLGRKLRKDECVWHKDKDCSNDDLSNLEVITRAEMCRRNTLH